MNKRVLLVLIPMIFLGLFASSKIGLAASSSTVVSLNPVFNRQIVGNDVLVNVEISDVTNLNFWEFKLFYETNSLNAIDVTEGPFLKSRAGASGTTFLINQINDAYNSTHGLVWVCCFILGTQTATGSGVLATIEFRGSNGGTSHMTLAYSGFPYPVILGKINSDMIPCTTTTGADVLIVGPESVPLDITIDTGPLYFPAERVEFYIMTTYLGFSVTPTYINAMLYNPNGQSIPLVLQTISTGFYRTTYNMPSDASSGTWVIIVEATYFTDILQACGKSFKTYLISPTLNSKLVSIEGNTATIQTTLGTIQGTITSINNNIATIQTDLGTVKLDISTVKTNTMPKGVDWTTVGLYISLAILATIMVVLVVLYVYMRARFRIETASS